MVIVLLVMMLRRYRRRRVRVGRELLRGDDYCLGARAARRCAMTTRAGVSVPAGAIASYSASA
jgi:hypothetical protein